MSAFCILRIASIGWREGAIGWGLPASSIAARRYAAGPPPFIPPAARDPDRPPTLSPDIFYNSLGFESEGSCSSAVARPFFAPSTAEPMKHELDREAAQTWLYPTNLPKRDYQFNIVRKALFQNALVALPTGLGKTFIAGCVMLNYARWFPKAKVFFLAPTKPLVYQQAQAFPETCGFLNSKITVLNGATPAEERRKIYPTKQVFFMTAQTLRNDLANGIFDARDIILLVVDEAHRATKDHAYAEVARMIRAQNPNMRILALTATPSSNPAGVQEVIDALGLSHIELLSETSRALLPYQHKKTTTEVQVPLSRQLEEIRDELSWIMRALMADPAVAWLLPATAADPTTVNAYTFNKLLSGSRAGSARRAASKIVLLGQYARAMEYLQLHSIRMFATTFLDIRSRAPRHQDLRSQVLRLRTAFGSYPPHPKALLLRQMLLHHFAPRQEGDGKGDLNPETTRVMVFCSYREAIEDILDLLAAHQPILRPVAFIGQQMSGSGRKGLKQSEQRSIIADFRLGKFNILVATSIGEEGLDIGSVDRVFCYDVPTSSIRLLQRIGRTGRQRNGEVTVLVGAGRETGAWTRAQGTYARVQQEIKSGDRYFFHAAPRLLSDDIEPECIEQLIPIDETALDFLVTPAQKATAKREAAALVKAELATRRRADKEAKAAAKAAATALKPARKTKVRSLKATDDVVLSRQESEVSDRPEAVSNSSGSD